jgi:hypothetical protein
MTAAHEEIDAAGILDMAMTHTPPSARPLGERLAGDVDNDTLATDEDNQKAMNAL